MTQTQTRPREAMRLPEQQLTFKTAATAVAPGGQMVDIDETEGIVTAIVSVTGVIDEVDDIIVPGAYKETLAKRNPKVCWAHSWEHPIGKVLQVEEFMPGDPRLPALTRDGQPWPKAAGALVAKMQFNLRTDEGKNAFEVVRFYSESGECEYSIGYNVPPGRAATDGKGTRHIKMLELYELSVVLFGAHTMTGTLSIKDAARAMEVKRVVAPAITRSPGVDFARMQVKRVLNSPSMSVRAGTGEGKAPVPPQFQQGGGKDEVDPPEDADDVDESTEAKGTCTCCAGSSAGPGEHEDGHECYVCDSAGTIEAQTEAGSGVEDGQPIVCAGHHGRAETEDREHTPDTGETDAAPTGTPIAGAATEEEGEEPVEATDGADGDPTARPPVTDQPGAPAASAGEPAGTPADGVATNDNAPDFSDGIMVAVYPDPSAADAVAAHIAGPDTTIPRDELHVTLAYLGTVGGGAPSEQEIIDSVTRAVEGQPALSGTVGGIGQFPAGDNGVPTYVPVDVPGLNMLREQIASELGDSAMDEHGFTPHMTLGYDIGIIDSLPATPIVFNEVRVVYGNSERRITLGAPVPESKTYFTETDQPEVEAKSNDLWFRTSDAAMFRHDGTEWKRATISMNVEAKAAAYDPTVERKAKASPLSPSLIAQMQGKAGGADRNRGGAEELRKYWTTGEGGIKIGWGTPGDFTRCVALLDEHMPGRAEGYCANRHHEMTGMWPGDDQNKDAGVSTDSKALEGGVPAGGKSYPQMPGTYEERQQAIREALYAQYVDDVDEHGHQQVWVDVRSTWPDRVLYTVEHYNVPGDSTEHFLVSYRMDDEGGVSFGDREEVDLLIVPVLADGQDDDVPLGDALPLVEDVMSIATSFKSVQKAMEGKAGRVLSGANERSLRTAVEHLINVLAGAGIDLGEAVAERARPTGNTGSDADVRREIDPGVDMSTTSPTATTKDAGADTEVKGFKTGEVPIIDMEAHRALLASIAAETADI